MAKCSLDSLGKYLSAEGLTFSRSYHNWIKTVRYDGREFNLLVGTPDSEFDLQVDLVDVKTAEVEIQSTINLLVSSEETCIRVIKAISGT